MLVVAGGIPGTMVRLSEEGTSLGRSADSSFQISDITVSREHAFVLVDDHGIGSDPGRGKHQRHVREWQADSGRIGWSSWLTAIAFSLGTTVVLKLVRLDPNDEQFQREMFERTVRDTLTGLYNRAYLSIRSACWPSEARPRESGWRC